MSKELVTVASLMGIFLALRLTLPTAIVSIQDFMRRYFSLGLTYSEIDVATTGVVLRDLLYVFAVTALPLLLVASFVAVLATMAQTRMLFAVEAFAFKGNRLNPLKGFAKMFSIRSLVELVKASLKIVLIVVIAYQVLAPRVYTLPRLMNMPLSSGMQVAADMIWEIGIQVGIVFAFLAAADYLYQWWEYERNLKMTKQEVKDEYKQMEGDPQVKGRIRSMQQQRARRRMMQNVPKADVVIRNPTHYAVAIQYDQTRNNAPVVVAKGADFLALRIIQVAEAHGVHVKEDRPLARALFEAVPLDREIPQDFYQAIAEVLAFVYSQKGKNAL